MKALKSQNGMRTQVHFDHLSKGWPNSYMDSSLVRSRQARFVRAIAEQLSPPAKVLDFGCGTGEIAIACAEAGFTVSGVDRSHQMIETARKRWSEKIHFEPIAADPVSIPYPESAFDAVIASSVLEYVDDPKQCFLELRRVCRHGGWLLFTVPNVRHWRRIIERCKKPVGQLLRPVLGERAQRSVNYLTLSSQRHSLPVWQSLLTQSGWRYEGVGGCDTPLWLIRARTP
jgi:ubiquinone/menaquinone biosynthesis C-methylase UbiE